MTIVFDNSDQVLTESIPHWLKVALENAQSAVLLSGDSDLKKQALVHVQQSAETATKGIALIMGMSYKDVENFRHDSLKLSGKILNEMMDKTRLQPFLGSIMPGDMAGESLMALGAILRATDDLKFRVSMQLAPPSDVKRTLELIGGMRSKLEHGAPPMVEGWITEIIASFNVSELYNDDSEFVVPTGIANWLEGQGKDADALEYLLALNIGRLFVSPESDHSDEVSDSGDVRDILSEVVVEKTNAILKLVMAFIEVLLIGAYVWPHYTYARYPAPPDAPSSLQEAAQSGKFGTQHYTDEIGVIRYIQELSQSILDAVGDLNDCYPELS